MKPQRRTFEIMLEMSPKDWRSLVWQLAETRSEMFEYIDHQDYEKFKNFDWDKCRKFHDKYLEDLTPLAREYWIAFVEEAGSGH